MKIETGNRFIFPYGKTIFTLVQRDIQPILFFIVSAPGGKLIYQIIAQVVASASFNPADFYTGEL